MKSKLVLLSIVFSLIFTNSIFADQKQLVGADVDYGEHLFGECVTCHNSTGRECSYANGCWKTWRRRNKLTCSLPKQIEIKNKILLKKKKL